MKKTCLKCGHVNAAATGDDLEACPSCGAIYSRVEAALAAKGATAPRSPVQPVARRLQARTDDDMDVADFAKTMRAQSLYPTFRSLVKLFYWFWILMAIFTAIGTAIAVWKMSGPAGFGLAITGLFAVLFFVLVARLVSETSLMIADLSDAAVRLAAQQEGK